MGDYRLVVLRKLNKSYTVILLHSDNARYPVIDVVAHGGEPPLGMSRIPRRHIGDIPLSSHQTGCFTIELI
jgi:hypothetical protein